MSFCTETPCMIKSALIIKNVSMYLQKRLSSYIEGWEIQRLIHSFPRNLRIKCTNCKDTLEVFMPTNFPHVRTRPFPKESKSTIWVEIFLKLHLLFFFQLSFVRYILHTSYILRYRYWVGTFNIFFLSNNMYIVKSK